MGVERVVERGGQRLGGGGAAEAEHGGALLSGIAGRQL
jgi:hypothetical protein